MAAMSRARSRTSTAPITQAKSVRGPRQDSPPMADLTSDPNDPRLGRGVDEEPVKQHAAYLILSAEERAKGFVRPVRDAYRHTACGSVTTMSRELAETYARDPKFY